MAPSRQGSVRRRGDQWQARWQDPTGQTHSSTHPTEVAAELWITAQTGRHADSPDRPPRTSTEPNTPLSPPTLTFATWGDTWLGELAHLRPSSLARAQSAMRSQLVPAFGSLPLTEITTAIVRRWVARLVSQGLAPATVTRTLRVLSSCLQVAAEDGLIPTNPARGIRPPQATRHEQRFLTAAEVARLADTIDQRYRGMVLLGCWGGLRFGEQVGLRVRCVNPLHGTVLVERAVVEVAGRQLQGPPKTAAGRRTVPLPRLVVDELLPYLQGKGPDDLVFTAPEGGMVRRTIWAARFWRPAVLAAGLEPLRVHDMRHTAVALWIAGGASPLETTRRAGHGSSARVLDIYGHLLDEGSRALTERLDEMFGAAQRAAGG